MRYAAILLSRQPLRPTGETPWVAQTMAAALWLKERGFGLISSTGMQTWELITALASDLKIPLRLVMVADSQEEFLRACDESIVEFNLDPELTEFLPCLGVNDGANSPLSSRDDLVIKTADLLVPVSCRPAGSMSVRIATAEHSGREINREFCVAYSDVSAAIKYDLSIPNLNPALDNPGGRYLVHWTRGTSSPWPGERRISFYRDVLKSDQWPRGALETLVRIVHMKKILASGRHMPGGTPTVSFSSLAPKDVIPLMRWRARYGEMSFEPYGIGIESHLGRQLGIREVLYYDGVQHPNIPDDQLWCSQSRGKIADWTAEREFRFLGDLSLGVIPFASLVLFCMTASEAVSLRSEFGCTVWPFMR